jgi:hypothetical protein
VGLPEFEAVEVVGEGVVGGIFEVYIIGELAGYRESLRAGESAAYRGLNRRKPLILKT